MRPDGDGFLEQDAAEQGADRKPSPAEALSALCKFGDDLTTMAAFFGENN